MFRWLLGMSTAAAQRAQAEAERNMKAIEEERKRILDHNERNTQEWPTAHYDGVRFANDLGNGPFIGDVTARKVRAAHLLAAPYGSTAQERTGLCIGGILDGKTRKETGLTFSVVRAGDIEPAHNAGEKPKQHSYTWRTFRVDDWPPVGSSEFGIWLHDELTMRHAIEAMMAVYQRR